LGREEPWKRKVEGPGENLLEEDSRKSLRERESGKRLRCEETSGKKTETPFRYIRGQSFIYISVFVALKDSRDTETGHEMKVIEALLSIE
jgi:hypothetical protein